MDSTKFTVLDIGHGNCSLIESNDSFTIIDAAQGNDLQNILNNKNINRIDDLIISHSDKDHVGGAIAILLDDSIIVDRIHLNPDGIKATATWDDFRTAVAYARGEHNTIVITAINSDTDDLVYPNYKLEVLAPSPIDCMTGPGTLDEEGKRLDANSMSVVLRLIHEEEKIALIPGDMDGDTLEFLKNEGQSLVAKILVFPHHGGRPGSGDPHEFSKELCEIVDPDLVLFSNSRRKHNNPIPEVIAGVRQSNCGAYLACTQISESCCPNEQHLSSDHLIGSYPSKGRLNNYSCAGSVTITLNGAATDLNTPFGPHVDYIGNFVDRKCV
ncbi:ComEC/Rec2 family competence protein [Vibrio harveyi]|uniref:ComEC/Rec2 family competence protein n=1 Tax=Vibrio harveyi TaxID=669 RepID=UPI000680F1BB|nr:MBL fold metallo-hydrolase [Vibrio harveyi]